MSLAASSAPGGVRKNTLRCLATSPFPVSVFIEFHAVYVKHAAGFVCRPRRNPRLPVCVDAVNGVSLYGVARRISVSFDSPDDGPNAPASCSGESPGRVSGS